MKNPAVGWLRETSPGLMMAGAAIGASHLVQSTRAGADFGWQLVGLILLVNLLKYPFFEFGHRYAAATGKTLLDGYARMGRSALPLFLVLAAISAVTAIAGVTIVAAALVQWFVDRPFSPLVISLMTIVVCVAVVSVGRYSALDVAMKVIVTALVITSITAAALAFASAPDSVRTQVGPSPWTLATLPFLIALMGWMPAPIEVSVFQSLWLQARDREESIRTTPLAARRDFNQAYMLTTGLALVFVSLGALGLHGTGITLANSGQEFSRQLIGVYRQMLGHWPAQLVAVAALAAMLSTTLAVIDGYPRALTEGTRLLIGATGTGSGRLRMAWTGLACLGALVVVAWIGDSMTRLVDLVTTVAFLAAPAYGLLNYRLVTSALVPQADRPGLGLRVLSWAGLAFLAAVGALYVASRLLHGDTDSSS